MNLSKFNVIAAAILSMGLAACTTTKAPEANGAAASAVVQQSDADRAAAEAAAKAKAARLQSQSLNSAQSDAATRANDLAASLGMKTFYFGYDDANLQSDVINSLKAHAFYLSNNSGARVQVNGHADERGTREYNMALGERRAKAVAAFLTGNGARASQLEVVSYGEEKPAVAGEGEESWAKNRRVELDYTADNP